MQILLDFSYLGGWRTPEAGKNEMKKVREMKLIGGKNTPISFYVFKNCLNI